MEEIEINGRKWQKYIGSEGQDVLVAMFSTSREDMIGKYANESDFDVVIDRDTDVYMPPDCDITSAVDCDKKCINCIGEDRVAFKFRKNVFTQDEQDGALNGLWNAAVESNNRGMAAGPRAETNLQRDWVTPFQEEILSYYIKGSSQPVDGSDPIKDIVDRHKVTKYETRGEVWLRLKIEEEFGKGNYKGFFDTALNRLQAMDSTEAKAYAQKIKDTMISGTSYATPLWSGIAGYYGRYPRIPYGRPTSYTENNLDKFALAYPFARKLDTTFAELLPKRYAVQKAYAESIDKRFLIGEDTTFTTITVNTTTHERNARMACHRDAGSLNEGFSNLTVISDGKKTWSGGYLVAPEVRAAINVRPGDLLLIDNMRIIHGNTAINSPEGGKPEDLLRMSLVFYFREDMLKLGSWEYEVIRRAYIDDCRKNPEHPGHIGRDRWNGVTAGWENSTEWYDYLLKHGGEDMLKKYHPDALKIEASLEDFF